MYPGNDAVEGAPSIAKSVLASAKLTEVASSLRNHVVVELEDDTTHGLLVSGNIKLKRKDVSDHYTAAVIETLTKTLALITLAAQQSVSIALAVHTTRGTHRASAPVAGGPVGTAAAGGVELMKRRNQDAMVDFDEQ